MSRQVNLKVAPAHFIEERVDVEELLSGPDTGTGTQLQNLLNANGHAHGRAGVEIIVIEGMRMGDHARSDATAPAVL